MSEIPNRTPSSEIAEVAVARICYIDTSLQTDLGHFANSCRHIAIELRRRNYSVDIYGHRKMSPSLVRELGAIPFFRHAGIENILAHAPIAFLHRSDFAWGQISFYQELKAIWHCGPYDIIYVNSISPSELAALGRWLATISEDPPEVIVEFGAPSGAGMADQVLQGSLNWSRRSHFYKIASDKLGSSENQVRLFTFDETASADYARLLHRPVETLPTIHGGDSLPRLRTRNDGRVTVSLLGHQRAEKGYHLVLDIVRDLQSRKVPAHVLVHNSDLTVDPVSQELRKIAERNSHLVFEHRAVDAPYWRNLLDRSDLLVLPYEQSRYRASYSAVAVEALSCGIPMVVPKGTTMELLGENYQAGLEVFTHWNATSVTNSIESAVTNFEKLAELSFRAASRWKDENGPKHFVDKMLKARSLKSKKRSPGLISIQDRAKNFALDVLFAVTFNAMAGARSVLILSRRIKSVR